MQSNVCKFILTEESERLQTRCFVYEQDGTTLQRGIPLEDYLACLVLGGTGTLALGEVRHPLRTGGLYFGYPGEHFSVVDGEAVELIYIRFRGGRVADLFWRFGITRERRSFLEHRSLIPFWQENLLAATEQNLDLVSECVLLYTFSRLARAESAGDRVIRQLLHYMEENYADCRLTLASAAAQCGYHPKYLSHRFKTATGVGFQRYLRDLRIRNATFLLDHGLDSVKNVSLLCGFEDALYFSRVFKECVGTSPREYLRARRDAVEEMIEMEEEQNGYE